MTAPHPSGTLFCIYFPDGSPDYETLHPDPEKSWAKAMFAASPEDFDRVKAKMEAEGYEQKAVVVVSRLDAIGICKLMDDYRESLPGGAQETERDIESAIKALAPPQPEQEDDDEGQVQIQPPEFRAPRDQG